MFKFYNEYLFPKYYDRVAKDELFDEERKKVLGKLHGNVLEIGIGTGLNLYYYPENVTSISAIDPNPGMKKQLDIRLEELGKSLDFHLSGTEDLPFENETFDCVLSTLVICSVSDVEKSLNEIARVLKPGGKFVFVDHGLSPHKKIRFLQNLLNPFQRVFADGCNLNLEIAKLIEGSSLSLKELKEDYLPSMPKTHGYMYSGYAVKDDIPG